MHPMYHGAPPPHTYPTHPSAGYPYHPHMLPQAYQPQHRGTTTPYGGNNNADGGKQPSRLDHTPNGKNNSSNVMMMGGGGGATVTADGHLLHHHHSEQPHDIDKAQMATAVSRKSSKEGFGSPPNTVHNNDNNNNNNQNSNNSKPTMDATLNVDHMKQDFYFFVQDVKEQVTKEATNYLRTCTPSPLEVEDDDLQRYDREQGGSSNDNHNVHPYLLFSNMNERLIAQWEELPQSKRAEYLVKEEEDRRRFQSAEEVASQHCATLTARARSPQAFSSRSNSGIGNNHNNITSSKKKVVLVKAENPQQHQQKSFNDARSPSPNATASLNKILQSEGNPPSEEETTLSSVPKSSRSSEDMQRGGSDLSNSSSQESPTKKNKVDPWVRLHHLHGVVPYRPEQHDTLDAAELRRMADRFALVEDRTNAEILEAERCRFIEAAERKEKRVNAEEDIEDEDNQEEAMEVESLLDRRVRNVRGKKIREYLVRWKGLGQDSDSWEPLRNVEHCENMIKVIDEKKRQEKEQAKMSNREGSVALTTMTTTTEATTPATDKENTVETITST